MNPDSYNPDGTIKKQGNVKVVWNYSNHYLKDRNTLKELFRKQADVRKLQHEILANEIIELGDTFYVETMDFKELQQRVVVTDNQNKDGESKVVEDDKPKPQQTKSHFGKSLANKAPAMLLEIIDRKLGRYDKHLIKIDTWSVKASQYNHIEDSYKKKKLSQRWNDIDGVPVQRDMYSAFLIQNVNSNLKSINQQKCNDRYANFLCLHNAEVKRLTGNKNLSSIAI
jgi:hypothetical protein